MKVPGLDDLVVESEYLDLVRRFPLDSIRDDAHMDVAMEVVQHLLVQRRHARAQGHDLSTGAQRYFRALSDLIYVYDFAHTPIDALHGVEALRFLMEQNGLTQKDLVPLIGHPSAVSEILAGKRRLALPHIQKLAAHFGLPMDVFVERDVAPNGQDRPAAVG